MKKLIIHLFISLMAINMTAQTIDTIYLDVSGVKLHTVLTNPSNSTSVPIVIIIAGSGPTDLNGNQPMMMNNSLKMLSDALVEHRIATFRFDKRAIAKSVVTNFQEADFSINIFANDVVKIIEFVKSKGFEKVFILGHSEGSLIGLIAIQETKVSGFISLAGAGSAADVILKSQLKPQLPPAMFGQAEAIIDSLKNGYLVKTVPPLFFPLFRPSVQPYLISWFKYDPSQLFTKIQCPALIMQGDKDLQIKTEDAQKLSSALPSAQLIIVPNMNHVLKTIDGDMQENISAYTNPELPISKELIYGIVNFLK